MYALTLTEPSVTVKGHSTLGFPAPLTLVRSHDCDDVTWDTTSLFDIRLHRRLRKITLGTGAEQFPVFEHTGAVFAATGLRARICTGLTTPHYTRAIHLWSQIERYVKPSNVKLAAYAPAKDHRYLCDTDENRFITYKRGSDDKLRIRIEVSYPWILDGERFYQDYVFPDIYHDPRALRTILGARSLGQVHPLINPLLSYLPYPSVARDALWVHRFPRHKDKLLLLKEICHHRLQDLLGALILATQPGTYLAGEIYSFCGGHECDVTLVHMLRKYGALIPVPKFGYLPEGVESDS